MADTIFPTDQATLTGTTLHTADKFPVADISENAGEFKAITALNFSNFIKKQIEEPFIIECVEVGTDLIPSTATPVATFYMPYACAANSLATFNLDEAGTGATLVKLDIHKNGASILSTKATIDSGATTSVGAATPMVYAGNAFAAGDKVEIFVDEIGNTTPGTGLIATIFATRT